jgi:DNA invertase Pin-like site-specific DNA recombinase
MPLAYSYVRFSTPEQAKGDSERRQDDAAKAYCKKHGLILDTKLNMKDLGVSGYRGKNLRTGALGQFIAAMKQKRIAPGSILLVENFDRISRDQIGKSIGLLLQIIEMGIEVVTLNDGAKYNSKTINESVVPLMISLMSFGRAHDESATKGRRVNSAWASKRARAATEKLTARAPLWLKLSEDRKQFTLIPERAIIMRKIFAMSVAGHGKRAIAGDLTRAGIPVWAKGKKKEKGDTESPQRIGWHDSYIQKILHNRAVIGEYQPHQRKNDKREISGDPIPNYYPAVIDETTFHKVQRTHLRGGNIGPKPPKENKDDRKPRPFLQLTNLFTGLVYCGFSDLPMRYTDKGTRTRGNGKWCYLTNSGKQYGTVPSSIHYGTFEKAFLGFVRHLDWSQVVSDAVPSSVLSDIDDQIASAEAGLREIKAKSKRLIDLVMAVDSPPKNILSNIQELEAAEENLTDAIRDLRARRITEDTSLRAINTQDKTLADLATGKADYETRLRLQQEIRAKVKRIKVWGRIIAPSPRHVVEGELPKTTRKKNLNPNFEVTFVNGVTRHVELADYDSIRALHTSDSPPDRAPFQIPWDNIPDEEINPKPFSKRPAFRRRGTHGKK